MSYEYILVEPQFKTHIALVRLNRPKELNALNLQLMLEMKQALHDLDEDENVRCIIITGNEQAFAAGADIKQMESRTPIDLLKIDQFETWDQIRNHPFIVNDVHTFHFVDLTTVESPNEKVLVDTKNCENFLWVFLTINKHINETVF
jgi:1,4-dihydroxy-2-naphthoyl-CoA synthase